MTKADLVAEEMHAIIFGIPILLSRNYLTVIFRDIKLILEKVLQPLQDIHMILCAECYTNPVKTGKGILKLNDHLFGKQKLEEKQVQCL